MNRDGAIRGPAARLALVALCLAGVAAVADPADAVMEKEAQQLHPEVLEVRHEPETLRPHQQWTGALVAEPGAFDTVAFQLCRVGDACFGPPAPMAEGPAGTWTYSTAGYPSASGAVDYQPGWRVGVKFHLREAGSNRTVELPTGPDMGSPACLADVMGCSELHYFTYEVAQEPTRDSPGLLFPAAALGVTAGAWAARKRAQA